MIGGAPQRAARSATNFFSSGHQFQNRKTRFANAPFSTTRSTMRVVFLHFAHVASGIAWKGSSRLSISGSTSSASITFLHFGQAKATEWQSLFKFGAYFAPLIGAIVADVFWGKYRTIMVPKTVMVAPEGVAYEQIPPRYATQQRVEMVRRAIPTTRL